MTLFHALYGQNSPSIPNYVPGSFPLPYLDISLQDRQNILSELKHNLEVTHKSMETQANNLTWIMPLTLTSGFSYICGLIANALCKPILPKVGQTVLQALLNHQAHRQGCLWARTTCEVLHPLYFPHFSPSSLPRFDSTIPYYTTTPTNGGHVSSSTPKSHFVSPSSLLFRPPAISPSA